MHTLQAKRTIHVQPMITERRKLSSGLIDTTKDVCAFLAIGAFVAWVSVICMIIK